MQRPSFFLGDAGILLLQWKLKREPALADALCASVQSNLRNPAREALWGSPGTLVAALHMLEATGEERWHELFMLGVAILWDREHTIARATRDDATTVRSDRVSGRVFSASIRTATARLRVTRGARSRTRSIAIKIQSTL